MMEDSAPARGFGLAPAICENRLGSTMEASDWAGSHSRFWHVLDLLKGLTGRVTVSLRWGHGVVAKSSDGRP